MQNTKSNSPKVTLLISTYNWAEALELQLMSLTRQSTVPDEIRIADDGSDERTKEVIDRLKKKISCPVIHQWHPDTGYHKTIAANKAVYAAEGDYIIQIDHDVILHKHFIKDHLNWARPNFFVCGRRAKLSKEVTNKLLKRKKVKFNPFYVLRGAEGAHNLIRFLPLRNYFDKTDSNPWNILGCNLAYWKKDFLAVNGYHNDIAGWGHDDTELMSRMVNTGIKKRELKFAAVQYHLHHKQSDKGLQSKHYKMIKRNIQDKIVWCENGIKEALRP
ncbi:glycosyltransferase family 2 protein [Fulvivirgaceae bacterium BMA12]|uniref:Glycosyltransferase family 2 protein n=1 Tax=Agaribacillus aureus TaxID=3051825 RepID=A0ABT8LH83_9BACT|nr:glycosyltransferase family 2 protein [Fulvivirgaceae bacterium BMA12]